LQAKSSYSSSSSSEAQTSMQQKHTKPLKKGYHSVKEKNASKNENRRLSFRIKKKTNQAESGRRGYFEYRPNAHHLLIGGNERTKKLQARTPLLYTKNRDL
jgi:hypothetical protein